jgi:outer membrane lipoprotein SlyB
MKRFQYLALAVTMGFVATACNQNASMESADSMSAEAKTESELPSTGIFGKTISEDGAVMLASIESNVIPGEEYAAKVEGEIVEVCQKKGCWMTVKKDDGSVVRVTFKDYGFFVPKDAAGKWVVMEGIAFYDTLSVATLQHYAEDAGKPADEVAKITEPEYKITFEAEGVIIKNKN